MTVARFIIGPLKSIANRYRPDEDFDGIADLYEIDCFGTNPLLKDTDGDGNSDGDEIFRLLTDPLAINTSRVETDQTVIIQPWEPSATKGT